MRASIDKPGPATFLFGVLLCAACSSGSGSESAATPANSFGAPGSLALPPGLRNTSPAASPEPAVEANDVPAGADASGAPSAASSATPGTLLETVEVEIEPRKLDVDEKKGVVRYNLDGGRMTHKYRVYEFRYDEYVKAIGGADRVKTAVKLRVELGDPTADVYDSKNPQEAKPAGGIETRTWAARVVEVLP